MTTMGYTSHKLRGAARPIDSAEINASSSRWTATARVVLLVTVLAAPLAFGAVQPWAWGALACLAAVALAAWAIGAASSRNAQVLWTPLYVAWFATLILGSLQWMTGATLDPTGTREALLKCCAYAVVFFLAGALLAGASDVVRRRVGLTLTFYILALSLFAIVQFFSVPGKLYGVIEPRFGGWVFGPYVNHNHYAGLMELLAPIVCAFGFSPSRQVRFLAWFTTGVAFTSVLISGSRGGAVCLALALAAEGVLAALRSRGTGRKWNLIGVVAAVTAVLAFEALMIPPEVSSRYQQAFKNADLAVGDRININRDSWSIFRGHLLAGAGLGAFEVAYPAYQSWTTDDHVDHAHNDFLEFLAEGGVAGAAIALFALAVFLALVVARVRAFVGGASNWLQVGAVMGACALLVHSLVDFNLHIPANAALFASLVAIVTLPTRAANPAPVLTANTHTWPQELVN